MSVCICTSGDAAKGNPYAHDCYLHQNSKLLEEKSLHFKKNLPLIKDGLVVFHIKDQ
jgi:hypothetical protein